MRIDLESIANEATSNLTNRPSGLRKRIIKAKKAALKYFFEIQLDGTNGIEMYTNILDYVEFLVLRKAADEFTKRTNKGGMEHYLDIFEFIYCRSIEMANDRFSGIEMFPEIYVELSKIYSEKGDIARAAQHAEIACRAMPQDPRIHSLLASYYSLLGRQQEAIAHEQIAQILERAKS